MKNFNYEEATKRFLSVADRIVELHKILDAQHLISTLQNAYDGILVKDNLLNFTVDNDIYTIRFYVLESEIILSTVVNIGGEGHIVDLDSYISRDDWYLREEVLSLEYDYDIAPALKCPKCGEETTINYWMDGGRYGTNPSRILLQAYGDANQQIFERTWECDCGHPMVCEEIAVYEIDHTPYQPFLKEVTERCPWCDNEVTQIVKDEATSMICPHCGKVLYLCDECMFKHSDCCNPGCCTSYCHEDYEISQWEKPPYPDPKY